MEPYIGIYYTEWLNSSPRMSHWTDYVDAKIDAMQIQIAGSKTAQMLLRARVAELEAENARLRGWLERIDGGDDPSDDASQLTSWAYAALIGHAVPE